MNEASIATAQPLPRSSPRILVIDDDEQLRKLIVTILERRGFDVTAVVSGREGKERMEQHSYDLVITDLLMPDEEGLGTIRWVRARGPEQPKIIAISGGGSDRNCYLQHAIMFGADATLAKPFAPPALLALVSRLVATRQVVEPAKAS